MSPLGASDSKEPLDIPVERFFCINLFQKASKVGKVTVGRIATGLFRFTESKPRFRAVISKIVYFKPRRADYKLAHSW
jgi:hypothetical protein